MFDEQSRTVSRKLPSVEDAAQDIRRLTAALEARRQVAPDNLVELAALAVDLQRASAVWRRLVPSGLLELGRSFPTRTDAVSAHPPSAPADMGGPVPAAQWERRNRESFNETTAQSPRPQR